LRKSGEVNAAVVVGEENILAVIAALRDVMRDANGHRASESCHALLVRGAPHFAPRKKVKG